MNSEGSIPEKVKDALSDPLTLAQIAAALDPGAILAGKTKEPLERAAVLLMDAGELCARLSGEGLADLRIKLVNSEADYEAVVASTLNTPAEEHVYFPAVAPDVLILSENPALDTLRSYLRERANFEGKRPKGKREAWKTTRAVKDNLRRWFIARANDENIAKAKNRGQVPQGKDWRDGAAEFASAMAGWGRGSEWHIPRDEFLRADSAELTDGEVEWRFIPWYRRAKANGGVTSFDRQMPTEDVAREAGVATAAVIGAQTRG